MPESVVITKPQRAADFRRNHTDLEACLVVASPDAPLIKADFVIEAACRRAPAGEQGQGHHNCEPPQHVPWACKSRYPPQTAPLASTAARAAGSKSASNSALCWYVLIESAIGPG